MVTQKSQSEVGAAVNEDGGELRGEIFADFRVGLFVFGYASTSREAFFVLSGGPVIWWYT